MKLTLDQISQIKELDIKWPVVYRVKTFSIVDQNGNGVVDAYNMNSAMISFVITCLNALHQNPDKMVNTIKEIENGMDKG